MSKKWSVEFFARTLVRGCVEVEAENEEEAKEKAREEIRGDLATADFDIYDGTFDIEENDIDDDLTEAEEVED